MKVEARLFLGSALFLAGLGGVYWFVSYERAGSTLLAVGVVAALLVGAWLLLRSRRTGLRPEDRPGATHAEAAGEVGWFPTDSVWPFALGAGMTIAATGVVFGLWLTIAGGALVLLAVGGLFLQRNR